MKLFKDTDNLRTFLTSVRETIGTLRKEAETLEDVLQEHLDCMVTLDWREVGVDRIITEYRGASLLIIEEPGYFKAYKDGVKLGNYDCVASAEEVLMK